MPHQLYGRLASTYMDRRDIQAGADVSSGCLPLYMLKKGSVIQFSNILFWNAECHYHGIDHF